MKQVWICLTEKLLNPLRVGNEFETEIEAEQHALNNSTHIIITGGKV